MAGRVESCNILDFIDQPGYLSHDDTHLTDVYE
jgi:hypothetical protein